MTEKLIIIHSARVKVLSSLYFLRKIRDERKVIFNFLYGINPESHITYSFLPARRQFRPLCEFKGSGVCIKLRGTWFKGGEFNTSILKGRMCGQKRKGRRGKGNCGFTSNTSSS